MPPGHTTGLTRPGFKIEPKLSIISLGKEKHLQLRMDVQMGTARNYPGPFSFRYTYHGKEYTDQDLGKDPFTSIRLNTADFTVLVQGKAWQKRVVYKVSIISDLGIVPENALASEYTAHVQSLDDIAYYGTENIEKAIRDFEDNRQKKTTEKNQPEKSQPEKNNTGLLNNPVKPNTSTQVASNTKTQTEPSKTVNNSKSATEDFWSEKKTRVQENTSADSKIIPLQPNHKNLPEFVRTTDGKFYRKGSDGRFRELSEQDYMAAKSSSNNSKLSSVPEEKKVSAEEIKAQLDKITNDARERDEKITANLNRLSNAMQQNYYYAEAIRNGKQNLAELSTLSGNYTSIGQLESEFNQKYASIRGQVQELEQARNAKLNNAANYSFNGSGTEQAIGEGVKLIGSIFNSAKASKEEKEAKAALKAERERQEAALLAARQKARTELRNQLLKSFPNGGTPLSSHKINQPAVYMFGYIIDPAAITNTTTNVLVSNVFPVNQYSDGSYPLKTIVANKLKGLGNGDVVLVGFYTDQNAAQQMRNSFINLASKSELVVNNIVLKTTAGSSSASSGASGDFWETGQKQKAAAADTIGKKKDDFWKN